MQLPPALNAVKNLLQGKGLVAHPIHVAINHVPLGLWEGAVVFDLMARRHKWRRLGEAGYYLNLFAIATAIPTSATGLAEWADIPTDHPAWKVATAHAVANDIALALAAYNWWTRRSRRGFAADQTNLAVDGALIAVLGLSGYLGGVVAHDYGYGTHRQGSSIAKEQESLVGPAEQIGEPKRIYTAGRGADTSLDSWAGTSNGEIADRDAAVEQALLNPEDGREAAGTGI